MPQGNPAHEPQPEKPTCHKENLAQPNKKKKCLPHETSTLGRQGQCPAQNLAHSRLSTAPDCSFQQQMPAEDTPLKLTVKGTERKEPFRYMVWGRSCSWGGTDAKESNDTAGGQCWDRAEERTRDDNSLRQTTGRGHLWGLNLASPGFQSRKGKSGLIRKQ